jgi:hypothetical protein
MIKLRAREVSIMKKGSGWKGARHQDKRGSQQASGVFNIKYESAYLNPDYDLEILQDDKISEQGLLLCGKLKPKIPSLPEFWLRWDEKEEELDIDMHGDSKHRKDWNNSRNGYIGHHAVRMKKEGRHFKVSIETPTMKVYDGVISFNLARDVTAIAKIGLHASAKISVNKKSNT